RPDPQDARSRTRHAHRVERRARPGGGLTDSRTSRARRPGPRAPMPVLGLTETKEDRNGDGIGSAVRLARWLASAYPPVGWHGAGKVKGHAVPRGRPGGPAS